MPEISICFHGDRFLMNKIKIKLSLMKNPSLTVKSVSVLTGICWCWCYMIQYFFYNNFSVFCKDFNLKTENIFFLNQPL